MMNKISFEKKKSSHNIEPKVYDPQRGAGTYNNTNNAHQNDLKPYVKNVKNVKSENMNKGQVKPIKNVKNLTSDLKTVPGSSMKVCHSSMKAHVHDSWNTLSDVSQFSKFSVTRVEERFSR